MPSDSSLKAFLSSLSPEDVATLFAGLRNTLPIGMGVYSPELNAGEAEIVGKRQAEREAARVREMEILSRLLPQAMAKRQAAIPESGADPFVPTRPRIMRESPFMFTQPRATPVPQQYATGGGVLADQTTPDMSDGGQMLTDPQPFAGGGSALKAALSATERDANLRKMLRESKAKTPLYHGTKVQDEYAEQPGQAFTQFASNPTWLAQEPYTASGYAGGAPGSSMYKVYAQVKKPLNLRFDANEEASKAFPAARRLGVDINHIKGMSNPQWAWEVVNHPSFIDAVEKAGYDAIKMNESGYRTYGVLDPRRIKSATGNRGTFDVTDPDMTKAEGGAVQAYQKGGSVFGKKSLDEMQAELLSKEGLSRRALFGLKPDYPLAKTPEPLSKVEQEVKRAEQAARKQGQAPSVTASRVDVDPGTGSKKSLMQSVTETPVSRRTVLKTAGSQVAQSMLPMGDLMKLAGAPAVTSPVGAIAKATRVAPALPVTMESVIAGAIGQGMRKREVINEALRKFPGQDFDDVEDVYRTLKDPYRYINFDSSDIDLVEAARPAETMRGFIGAPSESPLFSMRPYMRALRQASPEVYGRARTYSKDTAESAIEDLIDRGVLRSEDEIKRFLRNDPEIFEIMGSR